MQYYSILYEGSESEAAAGRREMPAFFSDLNLDQIVAEVVAGREEYNLQPFFYQSLKDVSAVNYRQEIMKEMERVEVFHSLADFSGKMKRVREFAGFSKEAHNVYQRQKWFLDAASLYCESIRGLHGALLAAVPLSKGLRLFTHWLDGYVHSGTFEILLSDTRRFVTEFNAIRYSVQIERDRVIVDLDEYEEDYSARLGKTFEKLLDVNFDYRIQFFTGFEMCVLENKILEIVRSINREIFDELEGYCCKHAAFLDPVIERFDREIQFYLAYLEYTAKLKRKGYCFSYPKVSCAKKLHVMGGYDLALAYKHAGMNKSIVANDFSLDNEERIFILTGPNQGGKTTFARAFGQILHLASLGCPVPCQSAELFLFDRLFTHFSTEENLCTNAGRLKEELLRLKAIMGAVTANSIVIANELFATTTSHDAYTMGKNVLDHFLHTDCICLYVTHIHELVKISDKTVSLIAAVHSAEDAVRTYKIFRRQADGCAYANSIVEKYSLSYSQVKERIRI